MRHKLSQTLDIATSLVSIKASTSEQLGFAGREEGMVAWAVAAITKE
jgi:2-C-methyl-D-erythritol 2,4-cyclodiphosphate synthase